MKKIKLFYNGARLKDIYPHATKWQVFKYKVRKFVHKVVQMTILTAILSAVVATTFFIGRYSKADIALADEPNYSQRVDSLKTEVVNKIKSCESKGYVENDGLIILDTNNKMSIGQLQFQTNTVIYYYQKLYGQKITTKEAVEIALDTTKATKLAKDIFFLEEKGLSNWLNCANKHNLRVWVDVINQLEVK